MIRIITLGTTLFAAAALLVACSESQANNAAIGRDSDDPVARSAKPKGWYGDNFFLGRWQGSSTAGRAVLDVLTVKPNLVRWGNSDNGTCESDYSVEQLHWGRNGRFPDQLVPPTKPTDLAYSVVRLTLQPRPCDTGVAMIQLARPLDGSGSLQVVTYDVKGSMLGNFPGLTELTSERAAKTHDSGGHFSRQDKGTWPLSCTINGIASSCRTEPAPRDGFTLFFSHTEEPMFSFTPVGAPTTDRREMVDGSGQRWAMSGHHSFELKEIGGNGNRITVSIP